MVWTAVWQCKTRATTVGFLLCKAGWPISERWQPFHDAYTEVSGADPGFCEGGFEQTSAYIILMLLLFSKSFFHKKKYGQMFVFVSL